MNNLYLLISDFSLEFIAEFLDLFSLFSILSALLVITNTNPIVSVLFLICLFAVVSCYLILVGMTFIGISYLLVYIGAISILFLFILMLINIRVSETKHVTSNSLPLGMLIIVSFFLPLHKLIPLNGDLSISENNESIWKFLSNLFVDSTNISYAKTSEWESNLMEITHISNIGSILYTNYFFLLILASIILLLAMVGSIIITKK
jgi:NADH-ubiquinone oxidoreductase chain 6